jgi:hypothetical protein
MPQWPSGASRPWPGTARIGQPCSMAVSPHGVAQGRPYRCYRLAYAFDNEGAAGRVVEPARQYFLIFGRIVPALHRRRVREFEDDDPFGRRSAFDEFGGAAAGQEAAAILRNRGGDRRPVGRSQSRSAADRIPRRRLCVARSRLSVVAPKSVRHVPRSRSLVAQAQLRC